MLSRPVPAAERQTIVLQAEDDFVGWREAARACVQRGVTPEALNWQVGDALGDLFAGDAAPAIGSESARKTFPVPRHFIALAQEAILHRDPGRFDMLYRFLRRLGVEAKALEDKADPLLCKLEQMAKAVRRDMHKMRAFLRFREVDDVQGGARFVAWFEPEHHILRANAGFFVRRFATMAWSILTPEGTIHWDGETLIEGPAAQRGEAPENDPVEQVWKTYYGATFNPARLKIGAMMKEMPQRYWKNLPEAALISGLVAGAQSRESRMIDVAKTLPTPPGNAELALAALREEARHCRRCPLWQPATQTVFGRGPADAALLFIGEQPGDQEDLAGEPFVGPAGRLFDQALEAAGIDRGTTYVSNAVKHFKFEPRGKRRIHAKPNSSEIEACRWWIEQERKIVRPKITVALGASAARSLLGKTVSISATRGAAIGLADGSLGWVTVHPSYLLRIPEEDRRREEYDRFVADLREIAARLAALSG